MPHEYSLAHGKRAHLDYPRPSGPLPVCPLGAASLLPRHRGRGIRAALGLVPRPLSSDLSFTSTAAFPPDDHAMFRMFRAQEHSRDWLQALLSRGSAFTCASGGGRAAFSGFAFKNHRAVREIGAVSTLPSIRGRGLASRVVRTALAELARRGLVPRYQVREDNLPSID